MSHVFPRLKETRLPVVAGGEGCYLIDSAGKRYFDGSGGAAISCLGHGDADITRAITDQLDKIAFAHTAFFTSAPAEALADALIKQAPGALDRVYFLSGGSEAIEAAVKLARQYFIEKGEPNRRHLIAREQSYHGNTLGALAAGGSPWRREPFAPLLIETSHIAPCYEYRLRQTGESEAEYGRRAADALEEEILRLGEDSVMAFLAEPVVGATLGAVPAAEGYFKRIREICDRYGVLLILDEVMCGCGRTGSFFACEQEHINPDIVTMAKGLGAGYQPIGAMLCTSDIFRTIMDGSGFFQHGHSYIGHPTACAAGLAVVNKLVEGEMIPRVRDMGVKLRDELIHAFGQHPHVGDIRGRGLFMGLELVEDRATKQPFPRERAIHSAIKRATFDAGLICYPQGGTMDGYTGDHILLAPPFIMTENQIGEVVDKLDTALKAVL